MSILKTQFMEAEQSEEDQKFEQQEKNIIQEVETTEQTEVETPNEAQPSSELAQDSKNNEAQTSSEPAQEVDTFRISSKNKVYIGNIPFEAFEDKIKEYFGQWGEISSLTLAKHPKREDGTQRHKGFAFIIYKDQNVAQTVISMNNHQLDGRELKVNIATPKTVKFFVGGLNKTDTNEDSLKAFFSKFGEITECFCVIKRGFGFVTMVEDGDNIEKLMEKGFFEIDGSKCDVKPAKKKEEMQQQGRRGGGFGGRGGRGRRGGYNMTQMGAYGGYGQQAAWGQQPVQYQNFAQTYNPYGAYQQQNTYSNTTNYQ